MNSLMVRGFPSTADPAPGLATATREELATVESATATDPAVADGLSATGLLSPSVADPVGPGTGPLAP